MSTGVITTITTDWRGDTLIADVLSSATSLPVSTVIDFDEAGGWLVVGDSTPRQYLSINETTNTVTLAATVGAAYEAGLPVNVWDPSVGVAGSQAVEYVATVELSDGSGSPDVVLPHTMIPTSGTDFLIGASVRIDEADDGDWFVDDVLGREPQTDGSFLDVATLPDLGNSSQTFSPDPPPATTDGYSEDHAWWQVVEGEVVGFWRVVGAAWVEAAIVKGEAAYFQNALIEALQVTGLTAVSIFAAQGTAGSYPQAFSGTSLPSGWVATNGVSAPYSAPSPSVTTSVPTGGSGSALLLDTGATGQTSGSADQYVTTNYEVTNFEALIRFRADEADFAFGGHTFVIDFCDAPTNSFRLTLNATALFGGSYRASVDFHNKSSGGYTSIASKQLSSPFDPSAWYWVRLRKEGGAFALSLWADGDAESTPASGQSATLLASGPVRLHALSSPSGGQPSRGQRYFVDQFDVTAFQTGFVVNADGSGEWPALGLTQGDVAWRTVGAVGEPAYTNGWTATSGDGVAFRRTPTGDVTMVGRATPGTANVAVFTLPVGYRPSRDLTDLITKAQGTGVFSTLDVLANGQVIARGTGSATWVSFTMSFPTS